MGIIKYPIITEKGAEGHETGLYVFVVDNGANKIQIKAAVEEKWNTKVESVRTLNTLGKRKIRHTKRGVMEGRMPSLKKAFVQLKSDAEPIDLYEGLE